MQDAVSIRSATEPDVGAILQIQRDSPTAAQWPEASYKEAIWQDTRLVLVAEKSGQVNGFLVASRAIEEWELENIAVSTSWRRQGVGRALLEALIRRAQDSGASEIRQEIRASNLAAQRTGQAAGFVQVGRRTSYYRDPDEDALLFNYLLPISK